MRGPLRRARIAPRGRRLAVTPLAMVNVDFASPSLVLGTALIGCGIVLLQARNMRQRVSRDADIVVAAMISIVGSTLIFQGWRLDPLLLLCQALTTSVAFWYGMETFKLRGQVDEAQQQQPPQLPPPDGAPPGGYYGQWPADGQQQAPGQADGYVYGSRAGAPQQQPRSLLPQPDRGPAPWQQQQPLAQQQQAPAYAEEGYGAGSSGRWGPDPRAAGGYAEPTIRYDYYGNPIEQQPAAAGAGDAYPAAGPGGDYGGGYPAAAPGAYEGGAYYPGEGQAQYGGGGGGGSSTSGSGPGGAQQAPGSYDAGAYGQPAPQLWGQGGSGGAAQQPPPAAQQPGARRAPAAGSPLPRLVEKVDDWE